MVRVNVLLVTLFLPMLGYSVEIPTLADLDRLQSERMYYTAQAALNKAKNAAVNGVLGEIGGLPDPQSTTPLPRLLKISGTGERLSATVQYPTGNASIVTPGNLLPGGYTVMSVSLDGVTLRRDLDGSLFMIH